MSKPWLPYYREEFVEPFKILLSETIHTPKGNFQLSKIVTRHLKKIEILTNASLETRVAAQKKFIQELLSKLSQMKVGTWDISLKQTLASQKTNCSSAASLLTLLLETNQKETGLKKIEFCIPYGHAVVLVHLADESIWYADPRNNTLKQLDDFQMIQKKSLRIYQLNRPQESIPFVFLTVLMPNARGIVTAWAGNSAELPDAAKGKFDESLQKSENEKTLRAIQKEAKVTLKTLKLTDKNAKKLQRLHDQMGQPIISFRSSKLYQQESTSWLEIGEAKKNLEKMVHILQKKPHILNELKKNKFSLKQFLLYKIPDFHVSNFAFEKTLRSYREAIHILKEIHHKRIKDFKKEVDRLLNKI